MGAVGETLNQEVHMKTYFRPKTMQTYQFLQNALLLGAMAPQPLLRPPRPVHRNGGMGCHDLWKDLERRRPPTLGNGTLSSNRIAVLNEKAN